MPSVEELLSQTSEDEYINISPINDIITIDPETRTINLPASEILFGTEQEMNVERKYFKCPKIVGDNIDLSKHQIYITYVTAKDNTGTFLPEEEPGLYYCEDMAVDGDYITFSWLLSGNVLRNHRFIAFAVSAKHMDGEVLKTRWKTKPAVGTVFLTVPDGEAIEERYPDIITQLLDRMNAVEEIATVEAMQGYVEKYMVEHPIEPTDEQTSEGINKWLDEHPEATTTVQDGAITEPKIHTDFLPYIKNAYVTLEMFGGSGDGETINDNAFRQAIESGYDIVLQNGTYLFSGEYIDVGNYGIRKTIRGNNSTVQNLCFKYNINSSNDRVVTSSVNSFNLCFEDIKFFRNKKPIVITCSNVDVKRCNFLGCDYCFAFPEYYIDYFHMSDCVFYNEGEGEVISTFNYDGIKSEYGCYGDWFVLERCNFLGNNKVYTSSPNHVTTIFINNCLHGIYTINNSMYSRNKFFFKGCHMEQGKIINNTPDILIPNGFVKIEDTFMYSSAFPININGFDINNVDINYGNHSNYALIDIEKGNFSKCFAEYIIQFNETEFRYGKKSDTLFTAKKSSDIYTRGNINSKSYQKYDAEHIAKYAVATSLEKERLYFNNQSQPIVFSNEFTIEANKSAQCTIYFDIDKYLKNVYIHIFKYMDGVLYRCVVPVTTYLMRSVTPTNNVTFSFIDEPLGVFGYPWEEFEGEVSYVTT